MTSCGHVTIIFDDVKTYGQIQVDSGIKSHHPNTFDGPAKHLLVGEETSLSQPVRMHNDLIVAGATYLEGNVHVHGVSTFQKRVEVDANLLVAEIPLSLVPNPCGWWCNHRRRRYYRIAPYGAGYR